MLYHVLIARQAKVKPFFLSIERNLIVSKDVSILVDELSSLTVLEMAKLKEMLEEKWGVKAASGMAMMAAPASATTAAPVAAVESTDFQVTLTEAPADKKLGIIKALREVAGLSLKDAKDLAEAAPKVVKETAPKAEADDMKKKIEAAGGKVSLKGL
jgi:large subunit ribosomal protein L7/L12